MLFRSEEIGSYITSNANDFIRFKTSLLLKDVANDPIRRAGLIRDIVETIAKIPDGIIRSTYTRECSSLMEISEQVLITELNKILRTNILKSAAPSVETPVADLPIEEVLFNEPVVSAHDQTEHQEADIIRLLLNYGDQEIYYEVTNQDKDKDNDKDEKQTITEKEIGRAHV